jgi:hypothetical protein
MILAAEGGADEVSDALKAGADASPNDTEGHPKLEWPGNFSMSVNTLWVLKNSFPRNSRE